MLADKRVEEDFSLAYLERIDYNRSMFQAAQVFLLGVVSAIGQALSISGFGFNLLDLVIIIVILFYAYEGYTLGFFTAVADLISFLLSFFLALKFYGVLGSYLVSHLSMTPGFANALGFFIIAFFSEIVSNILFRRLFALLPEPGEAHLTGRVFRKIDHYLGILPGMISALIVLAFILSLIIAFPSAPFLKDSISNSRFGSFLVGSTATYEKQLNDVFGGAIHETLNFMTVEPKSTETINLHFRLSNGSVDTQAEMQMFTIVNQERTSRGIRALSMDPALRILARRYSSDMFARGYFSHYNPEGQSPFDRMDAAGITYGYAGENLALAPSTELAMQGLMNSPGHKANILNVNFRKIGIGVIDGGIYGKMFTQEFTD